MHEVQWSSAEGCRTSTLFLQNNILPTIHGICETVSHCLTITGSVSITKLVSHGSSCECGMVENCVTQFDHSVDRLAEQFVVLN